MTLPSHGEVWSWTIQHITEPQSARTGTVRTVPGRLRRPRTGAGRDPVSPAATLAQVVDAVKIVAGPADDDGEIWSFQFAPEENE